MIEDASLKALKTWVKVTVNHPPNIESITKEFSSLQIAMTFAHTVYESEKRPCEIRVFRKRHFRSETKTSEDLMAIFSRR